MREPVARAIERLPWPALCRWVLSAPGREAPYRKVTGRLGEGGWLVEQRTATQAFHGRWTEEEARARLTDALAEGQFRQLTAWDDSREYAVGISKKGKVLSRKGPGSAQPRAETAHNREKRYLLPQGSLVPPLVDMGVFTPEGRVVAAMQDKYRQINRFVELMDDEVKKLPRDRPLRVLDFGCGKSYLTFVLYHYLTQVGGFAVEMTGLDLKEEVIQNCNAAAEKYGYTGLRFAVGDIGDYRGPGPLDLMVALHACDTATDYALFHGVRLGARLLYCAPCCQHELAEQMHSEPLGLLTRYGIVRERTAALMTDAIRGGLLECCGYKTQLLEFVELAHTPKNLLLRGVKAPGKPGGNALAQVEALMAAFSLRPTLYTLLEQAGMLAPKP